MVWGVGQERLGPSYFFIPLVLARSPHPPEVSRVEVELQRRELQVRGRELRAQDVGVVRARLVAGHEAP